MASERDTWFWESVSREKQSGDTAGGVLRVFNAVLRGVSPVTWVGEHEQIEFVA